MRQLIGLAAVMILAVAGCGGDGKGTVSGEVTLDGKPIETGLIRFVPTDTKLQPADGAISNGKYAVAVPPGESKVMISANKVVGKMKMIDTPDGKEVDKVEELLPARYNVNSELTLTVTTGSQRKNFELKGK